MKNEYENEIERPKWLKVALVCLSAWITFVLSFFFYALLILSLVEQIFKTDGFPGAKGVAFLVMLVGLSIVSAVLVAKWQHRVLARCRLRTNYIVLAILIILTILCVPTPFTYTIM